MEKCNTLSLKQVDIQSVDTFRSKIGFIKFASTVFDKDGDQRPGIVFMRGGSVAILVVLSCKGKEYTLLVCQDSIPTAQVAFPAIPAGMLDGEGNFGGIAAKELEEETGIVIKSSELQDLIKLSYGDKDQEERYRGMYVSVGGTDEFIRLFYFRKEVTEEELKELEGKCTGALEEGEKITLKIVPLDALWAYTSDSKALSALCLYQNLKAAGKIK